MHAKKYLMILALVLFLSAVWAKDVVNIGAIFSLSGGMQAYGEQLRDGALLRIHEQNSSNSLFKYNLVIEDDNLQAKTAVLAYRKLSQLDGCNAFLINWSGISNAVVPLARRDEKLTLSISWDKSVADGVSSFIHCSQPETQGELLVEALSSKHIRKVAIMCVVQQGFKAAAAAIESSCRAKGIDVTATYFNPGERDFRAHLLKIREFDPEAFVVLAFQPEFEICVRRIQESNPSAVITTVEGYGYLSDLKPYEGRFYAEGNYPSADFVQHYLAATQEHPVGYVALGYDMANLIIAAYEDAGERLGRVPNTRELAFQLKNIDLNRSVFDGLRMSPAGVIEAPAVLKVIKNGRSQDVTLESFKENSL
jgi:ABC-type branched-subunit amino acid transport system substrate-binding protein